MRFERTTALAAALVLALGAGLANGAAAQAMPQPEPVRPYVAPALAGFDAYVENVRSTFDVPGIAVAIIKDGEVVLERGYGIRDREANAPVDAHTLFSIASNTKAFTAASLEMLAEEGKLEMTDRVIDHLPWFRMSDPYVTHEMQIGRAHV